MPQKDYHGIAAAGFNASLRGHRNDRPDETLSLTEQLKRFGTFKEKRAIKERELAMEDNEAKKQVYDTNPADNINAFV